MSIPMTAEQRTQVKDAMREMTDGDLLGLATKALKTVLARLDPEDEPLRTLLVEFTERIPGVLFARALEEQSRQ